MTSGLWLAKPRDEPAVTLASTLVDRFDLSPPIDIDSLAASSADIFEEPWPFTDCDAMVVGLLSSRPSIFLRTGLPENRRRFTLAHELGHIKMGWHIGVVGCNPNQRQFETEPLQVVQGSESILAPWRLGEQEAEATRFASYLLIPERYSRPLVSQMDMSYVLRNLNRAGVSAAAATMRLRLALQPGFCFAYSDGHQLRLVTSSGTTLSKVEAGRELNDLTSMSLDHGRSLVGGRKVHWFRLSEFAQFDPVDDDRTTIELIRSAIAAFCADPIEKERLYRSINGVAGGSLSKDRAETVEQALAILRHKFSGEFRYGPVLGHVDFDRYLRRRAEEWARKRGL